MPYGFAVFENNSKIVIVMEYASKGDLYDYISERQRLTEQEARHFFRQVVSAVYYCHKVGEHCASHHLSRGRAQGLASGCSAGPALGQRCSSWGWVGLQHLMGKLGCAGSLRVGYLRGEGCSKPVGLSCPLSEGCGSPGAVLRFGKTLPWLAAAAPWCD